MIVAVSGAFLAMNYVEGIVPSLRVPRSGLLRGDRTSTSRARSRGLTVLDTGRPDALFVICPRCRVIFKHWMSLRMTSGPKTVAQKKGSLTLPS